MEAEMLVDMRSAVVDKDGDTRTDYVIDCRRRRSASVDCDPSENSRQPASPIPTPEETYWRDVIDNGGDKMAAAGRRCRSCNSDVSVMSLPESPTSDDDVIDRSPYKQTGNSFAAARQPEGELEEPPMSYVDAKSASTSGPGGCWSRDLIVRPPAPTAVGFSIANILRPDFGKNRHQSEQTETVLRHCPSYPGRVSLLRRSLVHPYTAAAAFCAAAVAAATAAGVQGTTVRGPTDPVHRQELQHQRHPQNSGAGERRSTTSRDVINNNNDEKLRSRYDNDDHRVDAVRQKTTAERRTRVQQPSPSSVRAKTSVASRPDQSVLASPPPLQTTSVIDGKQPTSDDASSPSLVPLQWPAWVYCTRYSDRPSSGRQSKSSTNTRTSHAPLWYRPITSSLRQVMTQAFRLVAFLLAVTRPKLGVFRSSSTASSQV